MSRTVIKGDAVTWMHLSQPTAKDLALLEKQFALPEAEREHRKRIAEVPRLRSYGDAHALVLHIPGMTTEHGRLERVELTVYVTKSTVVTIATGHVRQLEAYVRECLRTRRPRQTGQQPPGVFHSGSSGDVVANVLHAALDAAETAVEQVLGRVEKIKRDIYRKLTDDLTLQLGTLRRDAFALDMVIEPAAMVVAQFLDTATPYKSLKATASLQVLADRIEGLHRTLMHAAALVESMFQVRESLIAHRTSRLLDVLTAISVLFVPPTLITSYYGMNVDNLPLSHDFRLVSTVVITAVLAVAVLIFRLYRR